MKILPIIGITAAIALNSLPASADSSNPHKGQSLPPGIETKYEKTGELPPGWHGLWTASPLPRLSCSSHCEEWFSSVQVLFKLVMLRLSSQT